MIFFCIVRHLKTGFVKLLRSEELAAQFPESAPFSDSMNPARCIEDRIVDLSGCLDLDGNRH